MKNIVILLMVAMIGFVIFAGTNGIIANFVTGTSTADTAVSALWILAFLLAITVMIIFRVIGRRGIKK